MLFSTKLQVQETIVIRDERKKLSLAAELRYQKELATMATKVQLYIYDLSQGLAAQLSGMFLGEFNE